MYICQTVICFIFPASVAYVYTKSDTLGILAVVLSTIFSICFFISISIYKKGEYEYAN